MLAPFSSVGGITINSEKLWRAACHVLEKSEWIEDPHFANNAARVKNRDALCAQLAAIFATQPAAHWFALFERAGVPAAPSHSVREALNDPLTQARGMTMELGGVPMVASPLQLSRTPVDYRLPPPQLGEHSDELARRFGVDPETLRAAGAIR